MPISIVPVPCPNCGEAQNVTLGNFDPEAEPFGPVTCMACGRKFDQDEYLAGLKIRHAKQENP
jgi:predicted RNA-binding Zn-ribbon protein involved in translation (DUF1610 family)